MIEDDDILLVGDPQIQMQVFTGNWVCNWRWLNQLHHARCWYTVGDVIVPVRMQNVLSANSDMTAASQENPLPRMSQAALDNVMLLHPIKLNALDHDFMMDELFCQQLLDHDEEVNNDSDENCDLNMDDEDDEEDSDSDVQ